MKRVFLGFATAGALAVASSSGSLLQQAPAAASALRNPYEGKPGARLAGAKLFQRECASCHGPSGEGTGRVPPLASPAVRNSPPGAVYWVLRNGAVFRGMPSFSHFPAQQRWQLVTYLQMQGTRQALQ